MPLWRYCQHSGKNLLQTPTYLYKLRDGSVLVKECHVTPGTYGQLERPAGRQAASSYQLGQQQEQVTVAFLVPDSKQTRQHNEDDALAMANSATQPDEGLLAPKACALPH
jgi:hypothetical protein